MLLFEKIILREKKRKLDFFVQNDLFWTHTANKKMWFFFYENSDAFLGKLTFCEFHIFLYWAHKMKYLKKKNIYFFLEKMLIFITIICVD